MRAVALYVAAPFLLLGFTVVLAAALTVGVPIACVRAIRRWFAGTEGV